MEPGKGKAAGRPDITIKSIIYSFNFNIIIDVNL